MTSDDPNPCVWCSPSLGVAISLPDIVIVYWVASRNCTQIKFRGMVDNFNLNVPFEEYESLIHAYTIWGTQR